MRTGHEMTDRRRRMKNDADVIGLGIIVLIGAVVMGVASVWFAWRVLGWLVGV